MKKIFKFFMLLLVLSSISIFINSCNKEEVKQADSKKYSQEELGGMISQIKASAGLKLAWGSPQNPQGTCNGAGECGPCPGICIKWTRKKKKNPNPPPTYAAYDAKLLDLGSGKMKILLEEFSAIGEIDNGDGTATIETDEFFDQEIADDLEYNSIKALSGTYNIDYSTNSFGSITIDVITN